MSTTLIEPAVEALAPGVGIASDERRSRSRIDVRLLLAVVAVWVLWGSTFAGMRFTVGSIPPFPMASIRFLVAGGVLLAICAVRGRIRPARSDVVLALVTGFSLLLLGNGSTAWTVQYLPTGINSLLLSLSPVWMALIAFAWGGEKPTRAGVAGMVLGFGGLALLLQPKSTGTLPFWPVVVCLLSSIAWAFGSIYQRRVAPPRSIMLATALQMLAGGVMLALEGAAFGQWRGFDPHAVAPHAWIALAYLALFGSLAAYSAYVYTMQAASTALASTYAYVNPIVAVVLGMLLFHERFTPVEALASAVIVGGVALMMLPRRAERRAPARATALRAR